MKYPYKEYKMFPITYIQSLGICRMSLQIQIICGEATITILEPGTGLQERLVQGLLQSCLFKKGLFTIFKNKIVSLMIQIGIFKLFIYMLEVRRSLKFMSVFYLNYFKKSKLSTFNSVFRINARFADFYGKYKQKFSFLV